MKVKEYILPTIALIVLAAWWGISEYYKPHKLTETETFQWAVDFCGSKDKIDSMRYYRGLNPSVICLDGRASDIPTTRDN